MDHLTYKNWILDEAVLSEEEKADLETHILECPECLALQHNLDSAILVIRSSPEVPAPANFTRKFTESLAARKHAVERKQARTLTLSLITAGVIIMLLSLYFMNPDLSLIAMSAGVITTIVQILSSLNQGWEVVTHFTSTANPATLVVTFFIFAAWLVIATFTLGLSIWKLVIKKTEVKQ